MNYVLAHGASVVATWMLYEAAHQSGTPQLIYLILGALNLVTAAFNFVAAVQR